ncbi:DcaP family trimeric outer membrane transporter [Methylomonas sp. MS20]|uniref:DcaP family trimeric outer membrane transporter n=1 Tax=unclassified Methylomonas TaxID=2608980 RepID=UPI0028A4B6BD|nr:DcaP family trimeric outer membrane transporter [Methylomonas sp. MV1]MDT4331317.1 DcaP family trimeric outer membrane transporter [Methylomonas sp. MV1]
MHSRPRLLLTIASGVFPLAATAADDVRALLRQLGNQVAELKQHADQADARIRDLETRLAAEQQKNRQLTTQASPAANGVVAVSASPAANPTEAKPETKPPVTLGDTKGTFKIPGTDTSLGFGGFVKLDVNENSVSAPSFGDQYLSISNIPVSHRGEDSQLAFNARESRFWFKSFTPSTWGDINTYLELDLYGAAASYTPRLRHAYGSFGNFLAGQTWTTFLNELAAPDTLDNAGPVGLAKFRQPLVRWTQPFKFAGESLDLQLAAESPNSTLWTGSGWSPALGTLTYDNLTTTGDDRYPDLIAKLVYKPDWGNLSLAAMGRQIRNANNTSGAAREAWGGGVSLAGKINVFELDNIRFTLNYGNAIGRYSSVNRLEDAALDSAGNLHLVNVYSAVTAYQHWWSNTWRSTFAYGFEQADQPDFVAATMTRQAQSVHANLLWSPLPQATLGIEYLYGSRELIDGRNGNISRAMFSAKYNF